MRLLVRRIVSGVTYVTSLPPFQPGSGDRQFADRRFGFVRGRGKKLTLQGIPDEVQKAPLEKGDIRSPQTPGESVLHGKANVPGQATPGNDACEERNNQTRDDDNGHRLAHRKALRQESVGCLPCSHVKSAADVGEGLVLANALMNKSLQDLGSRKSASTYSEDAPKKLNHPQVRLEGGRGTRSRLHHAVVSSLRVSSAGRTIASLILRMVRDAMLLAVGRC